MPRAPSNEIPYNMPWGKRSGSKPVNAPGVSGAPRAGRAMTTRRGRSPDSLLQRTLKILENPTRHPLEREPQRRALPTTGLIAIVLILLVILFAIYQYDVRLSSSRSELASSRIQTAEEASSYPHASLPRIEIRWGYDPAKPIEGFFIYRCMKTTATDCLDERDYRLVASVGRYTRSFAEVISPGSIFCYRVSAYNKAGESARTPLGCRAR
jgi:hypothetical protein